MYFERAWFYIMTDGWVIQMLNTYPFIHIAQTYTMLLSLFTLMCIYS